MIVNALETYFHTNSPLRGAGPRNASLKARQRGDPTGTDDDHHPGHGRAGRRNHLCPVQTTANAIGCRFGRVWRRHRADARLSRRFQNRIARRRGGGGFRQRRQRRCGNSKPPADARLAGRQQRCGRSDREPAAAPRPGFTVPGGAIPGRRAGSGTHRQFQPLLRLGARSHGDASGLPAEQRHRRQSRMRRRR